MANDLPLSLRTLYAELVDRAASDVFDEAFAEEGAFVPKVVRGRRYWYFQAPTSAGRAQRYVGPETPELLDRIERHKESRKERRDRHALVSTLIRSGHLPAPQPEIGDVIQALARAGVFRLRGVLVGTTAYQTYAAMLGARLPMQGIRTEDVDIAQFTSVSVAVEDRTPPILEVLKSLDPTFRAVSEQTDSRRATRYLAKSGIRVDFLSPNRGPDSDEAVSLPTFRTDAAQLRFLDFLIYDPEPAVVLHDAGVYVVVPAPQRYALHKLIVARRRRPGTAKSEKDVHQAEALLDVLARKRPRELKAAWNEAYGRGSKWRKLLGEGLSLVSMPVRDEALKAVGAPRNVVDGLDLAFSAPAARYDPERDVVLFRGEAGGKSVRCAVSRAAIDDHFALRRATDEERLRLFREHRPLFERMARAKYLHWPVEQPDEVLVRSEDRDRLLAQAGG